METPNQTVTTNLYAPGAKGPRRARQGALRLFAEIRNVLAAATRRRRLLLAAMAGPLAAAGLYLFLTPAHYAAVLPVAFRLEDGAGHPGAAPPALRFDKELRLLTSRELLRRVAETERALADPAVSAERSAALEALLLGAARRPGATLDALADRLAQSISLRPTTAPASFDVEIRAEAPEAALRLAQALGDAYREAQAREDEKAAEAEGKRNAQRLSELQSRMDEAARRLAAFREANPGREAALDMVAPLTSGDPNAARANRAAAENRLARIQAAIRSGGAPAALENLPPSPTLDKLRADHAAQMREVAAAAVDLLPRHPDYLAATARLAATKQRLLVELRRVEIAARRDVETTRAAEKRATRENAAATLVGDTALEPRAEATRRRDEAARARELYEEALTQRPAPPPQTARVAAVFGPPRIARGQAAPQPLAVLLSAVVLGVGIWLGESARREFAEAPLPQSRTPPSEPLIALPRFATGRQRRRAGPRLRAREIMETPGEPYRLAVGALYRLLTQELVRGAPTLTIAIEASAPGAGASTLALALALFAAGRGDRVLLIEAGPKAPSRRREYSAGEIVLAPGRAQDPRLEAARERRRYDLILVDCGDGSPAAPVDATLIVGRDATTRERLARLVRKKRAAEPRVAGPELAWAA